MLLSKRLATGAERLKLYQTIDKTRSAWGCEVEWARLPLWETVERSVQDESVS